MIATSEVRSQKRPTVESYDSPKDFLVALFAHYKSTRNFSLRQRAQETPGCSQALLSQILNGKRSLNRGNLPKIAAAFKLTKFESERLDSWIKQKPSSHSSPAERTPRNHLLANWLNAYVKDLTFLRGFEPNAETVSKMLNKIVPASKVQKSIDFLLREGFWRRTLKGKIVAEEDAVVTTNEIPNEKIREFHLQALRIAEGGLKSMPATERKASTVLISVDVGDLVELRELVDSFQQQLQAFIESHPEGKEKLVQITTHLTPVGTAL